MSAKLVLDTAAMAEDFFADTALIGAVCALPVYRFVWLLNQKLDTGFVRKPDMDIVIQSGKGSEVFFPVYQYCTPLNGCQHLIYQLKSGKEPLLPEIKQLDYLWLIQSTTPDEDAKHIINQMRDIGEVQLAQYLSLDKLKNHQYLIV